MIAIKAKRIFPVCADPIDDGVILVGNDGKIAAVGHDINVPESARIIDASDMYLTPGLIDAHTYIGLSFEPRGMREQSDLDESSEPFMPELSVLDGFYPYDSAIVSARTAGFTSCYVAQGSKCIISGRGAAFKMKPSADARDMFIDGTEQLNVSMGELPIKCFSARKTSPQSRGSLNGMLREYLRKAAHYAKSGGEYDAKLEAMKKVMNGEMTVHIHACRQDDIQNAMLMMDEFSLKYAFSHATEAYMIAEELVSRDIPCVFGQLDAYQFRQELWNNRFDTPAVMSAAGLGTVCVTCDETDAIKFLRSTAGRLVAFGMPWQKVLESLTAAPARLLGVQNRIGTIAQGMDADIAFFNGDPLSNLTLCMATMIDGVYYEHAEESR